MDKHIKREEDFNLRVAKVKAELSKSNLTKAQLLEIAAENSVLASDATMTLSKFMIATVEGSPLAQRNVRLEIDEIKSKIIPLIDEIATLKFTNWKFSGPSKGGKTKNKGKREEKKFVYDKWCEWQKKPELYRNKTVFATMILKECNHLDSVAVIANKFCPKWETGEDIPN